MASNLGIILISISTIVTALVLAASRTFAILIAVRGTESRHRAAVLQGLAECMKWWKRR